MTTMIAIKLTLICFFFLILLLFILRPSSFSSSEQLGAQQTILNRTVDHHQQRQCITLPASVSQTFIHYATTNTTPHQTLPEISVTDRVLRRKSPCNLLVFSLANDSLLWSALNHAGRTLHVTYSTKLRHADAGSAACSKVVDPRDSDCTLALRRLPQEVYEVEWDIILVEAPAGRMSAAVYTAGLLARNREGGGETDVMVHDVEEGFSMAFLCEGYMVEKEGRLSHFVVPSHRGGGPDRPFCP